MAFILETSLILSNIDETEEIAIEHLPNLSSIFKFFPTSNLQKAILKDD